MATFASINTENQVTNIFVSDSLEIAQMVTGDVCIEYTDENPAAIGYIWNGTKFIEPPVEAPTE